MTKTKLLVLALCATLAGCFPRQDNPPLLTYPDANLVFESARLHAVDLNGRTPSGPQAGLYLVMDTHSMEPVIMGGDFVVVDTKFPFADLKAGQIITYRAAWAQSDAPPVTHRTQVKFPDGWVVEGDNNGINGNRGHVENTRVTAANYLGKVVGIYRLKR